MAYTQKHPSYTFVKDSIYYFSRAVPSDLRHHYKSSRIVQSLRTKSSKRAATASKLLSSRLDDYWLGLRLKEMNVPAAHLLTSQATTNLDSTLPTIDEAMETYLSIKGRSKGKYFFSHTKRAIGYLKECLGIRRLDQYTTADASKLRDWLLDRGLQMSSIQRNFASIKAVVSFAINELGLECNNAFQGVYLANDSEKHKRLPIQLDSIQKIQQECIVLDDDLRHLIALISDTGIRLGEAVGLLRTDIILEAETPHIIIQKHPHRPLKTSASARVIPLIGCSLWAAKRLLDSHLNEFCFPRYANQDGCKTNSASAALNKWVKTIAGKDAVIHGLRHSFRDRLRAADAPSELIDQLGGWSVQSVGQGYGNGYPLKTLHNWMTKSISVNEDS